MFRIENGRECFWQWDANQRLIVDDAAITEVHFCNKTDDCALVCEVFTENGKRLVNVPNILLQQDWKIRAYAYLLDHTVVEDSFKVCARSKPADYVYTETDVFTVEKAVNDAIEKADILEKAKDYTNEELSNTKEYINQELSTIDENKVSTTTEKYILYGRDAKGEKAFPYAAMSAKAASFPLRTDDGCIFVESPTSNKHAANKKYVDDAVAAVNGLSLQDNGGLVINDGSANGSCSIAGGTTDESVIENIVGSTAAALADVNAAAANGELSISYGVDTIADTAGTTAMGVANMAGAKGYYWHSINFTTNTINLSTTRKAKTNSKATIPTNVDWAVGDYISIRNKDRGYAYCSKITKVYDNVIVVDSLPFDADLYTSVLGVISYDAPYDRTIYAVYQENYLGQSKVKRWKCRGGTVDLGFGSVATGMQNAATGIFSSVEGRANLAAGDYSHAEGRITIASGEGSHAEGQRTKATGYASHAEGTADSSTDEWVIASGDGAHAEGYAGEASGNYAHKEGHKSTASGGASHAEGDQTEATNWAAHTEGQETKARGIASHAEGFGSIANGNYAHAEGEYTIANGYSSHAAGISTAVGLSNRNGCTIVGRYGTANEDSLFAVAGGTSADDKKLVFEVKTDGSIIINSSTPNSTARFKITVNDDGVLTATKI